MKNNIDIYNFAQEHDYTVVETTSEWSGYPRDLQKALTGFSSMEELEKAADEIGGEAVNLEKKNGWNLYARTGWPLQEMEITSEDYGDDYFVYGHDELDYLKEFYADERKSLLEEEDLTEDGLREYDEKFQEAIEELKKTKSNQAIVVYRDKYIETIETKTMSWYDEGNGVTYTIGLLLD